jgi:serine/threonine-protein kinase
MTEERWVGQTLAGKYRVERVLGKGGMGLVVEARHIKLDEPVAIKLLRPAMMEVDGMVARFVREARAASKIKSEHVVRVTDVDILPDGVPYMVMELLSGSDFFDLRTQQGKLGVAEVVGWVVQACDAVAEAHALGIVHRDLKPSNLFLHRRGDGKDIVKVLDFGLSKVDAPGEMETTRTGQVLGSPKYMSPEQMLSMHDVDGRSDIWSLGVILYELCTGQAPFAGDTTPRVCAQVLNAEPPPPSTLRPDLPDGLDAIILRCLRKERAQRFPNIGELVAAIVPFGSPDLVSRSPRLTQKISSSQIRAVTPASPPEQLAADDKPTAILGQGRGAPPLEGAAAPAPPARAPSLRVRVAAVLTGVAILATVGVSIVRTSGVAAPSATASMPPSPPSPPPPATTAVPLKGAPEGAPAPSTKPALNADDLPDTPPTPSVVPGAMTGSKPSTASSAGVPGKKPKPDPKPEPPVDPFGGRRH